ncbi:hypothetical protein Ahy_B05g079245 [Arachis hypogaea]|uniref:Uncharacterized protein n=1 Tax=Arachis hypogaea TaxID=3818 RepID=A0A444Z9A7_ARAHY|nr:hypothetical protein Ahy_B05g079245 [Arachis hypogaea]
MAGTFVRLRSRKVIHMVDDISNTNIGSSTNDNIPVVVAQMSMELTSHMEGTGSTQNPGVVSRENMLPFGLPPDYTPPISSYVPPIRFENAQGAVNNYPPIHHLESAYDYQVGSTSNNFGSMAAVRQYVDESHHDLVNLLTQQMTTILNPMMANHEKKFERVARQVKRIAQIVDYDEGNRQNMEANLRDLGIDPRDRIDHINLDGNAPHIIRRDQNVDEPHGFAFDDRDDSQSPPHSLVKTLHATERYPHPYKACFVPLSNRCGTLQSTPLREPSVLAGTSIRSLALIPSVTAQTTR